MTNNQLNRERLEIIKSWRETYGAGSNVMLPAEEAEELARMALAAMDSEPVAYTDERNLGYIDRGRETAYLWGKQNSEAGDVPLYRHAQPASVVPRVTCWSCRNQVEISAIGDCDGYCPECDAPIDLDEEPYTSEQPAPVVPDEAIWTCDPRKRGEFYTQEECNAWNACRAAMLQAGNSPVIPEGYVMVPMRLTAENGAKGALSGEFSETKFVNCPECFGDDECETCDGSGRIEITLPVTWTTIKEIWAKGVEHFAAAPQEVNHG